MFIVYLTQFKFRLQKHKFVDSYATEGCRNVTLVFSFHEFHCHNQWSHHIDEWSQKLHICKYHLTELWW